MDLLSFFFIPASYVWFIYAIFPSFIFVCLFFFFLLLFCFFLPRDIFSLNSLKPGPWCKFNLSDRNNVKIRCCSIHFQCIDPPQNGCRLDPPPPGVFSGRGIWTALLNQEMINLCNLLFKLFCILYRIYVNANCTLIFFFTFDYIVQ